MQSIRNSPRVHVNGALQVTQHVSTPANTVHYTHVWLNGVLVDVFKVFKRHIPLFLLKEENAAVQAHLQLSYVVRRDMETAT